MDRMNLLDASFLYSENENDLHHNAWLGIFEGPAPTGEEFRRFVASKLPLIPRYRQRVRFVPNDLAAPVWVDDVHFNLDYHVRNIALPAPGSEELLRQLFTVLMAEPLDRGKPLWQMWAVDGLADRRWALISKLHHCMADGATTTDMTTLLLDADAAAPIGPADRWQPEPPPTDQQLVEAALAEAQAAAPDQMGRYAALMTSLRDRIEEVDHAFASLDTSLSRPLSIDSLNGPIGPYRRWRWARAELADFAAIRSRLGGTVNDIVLAMVTRGFRDLLISRGEPVEDRTVRSMVPVSVRSAEDTAGNRVSAMYAELPVGVADPVQRLDLIRRQLDDLKASKQALAGDVIASLAGFQPPMLAAMGARAASHAASPVNTVTTNVPGPQHPLYALGRLMLDDWPYITLASTVRIATTVFSYNGALRIGVTGDLDSTPDLDVYADGLGAELAELLAAADRATPPPTPRKKPAKQTAAKQTASKKTASKKAAAKKTAKKAAAKGTAKKAAGTAASRTSRAGRAPRSRGQDGSTGSQA